MVPFRGRVLVRLWGLRGIEDFRVYDRTLRCQAFEALGLGAGVSALLGLGFRVQGLWLLRQVRAGRVCRENNKNGDWRLGLSRLRQSLGSTTTVGDCKVEKVWRIEVVTLHTVKIIDQSLHYVGRSPLNPKP